MNAFNQLSPQINTIFNSDDPFLKNNKVHLRLHHIRHRQRIYRRFMIQEMNNNPECHEVSKPRSQTDSSILISQIEKEIKVGIIKPINPKQL
jgi:hypothetical protein